MLRRALSWLVWPSLVGGGVLGVHLAVARGAPLVPALAALQIAAMVIVAALERWMPEHPSWNVARGDVAADLTHTLVSGVVVSSALRLGVFALVPSLGLWPASWPVPVQLLVALALADLGSYGTHVLTHKASWLWPIHAIHHSSRRLYWLNTLRMHPLDSGSTVVLSLVPLALLGVPLPVLALFDAFAIVHLVLQHSNVRLRLGWLDHVIASADFHRWHHSPDRSVGERNYASFLSLWDYLFGTFAMPRGQRPPEEVGLYDGASLPDDWPRQVRHPFAAWAARRRES